MDKGDALWYAGRIPQGKKHAISARSLARIWGTDRRGVRLIVHELRSAGYPVCSGQEGYWRGCRRDIVDCVRRLIAAADETRHAASCLLATYAKMGKTP